MSPTLNAVRKTLCARIQSARIVLDKPTPIRDEDVHAARKHLKGARAGLRLLRTTVGERTYTFENARLRDAARPLSAVRDAKVLLETTRKLIKSEGDGERCESLHHLMGLLRKARVKARSASLMSSVAVKSIVTTLTASERNVTRWVLDGATSALQSDIERLYRKSRKAMRVARKAPTDDALHEARKQAKYLALALEVLHEIGYRHVEKSAKPVTAIGDHLGADRDLALLQSKLITLPKSQLAAGRVLSLQIQGARTNLQNKAFRIAKRAYTEKARVFVKRLSVTE